MKRIFLLGVLFILALAIAGSLIFQSVSQSGSNAIEQWIGSQLQTIANSYLNPQLKFSDLDYTYPLTVSLKDLSLRAEDPANPGQTIDIIAASSATLTLAEIPRVGSPVVIERIVLDRPLISAVAIAPGSKKFVGFSNLLRFRPTTAPADASAAARSPTSRPALSDVFEIRLIKINDGSFAYDPRVADTEPMLLDQINTDLKVEPSSTGWYVINTTIARKEVFDLKVLGELNLDSFSARGLNVKLSANVAQDKLGHFPPQLQKILKQYEISGALDATVGGELPIMEPAKGNVTTDVKLRDANITLGEFRIPVKTLDLAANLKDGSANLTNLTIDSLRGSTQLQGSMLLNQKLDTELKLTLAGLQLQDLLAGQKEGEPLKLAGKLNGEFQAKAPLRDVLAKADFPTTRPSDPLPAKWGAGSLELTEGRLIRLRLFKNLTETVGSALKLVGAGQVAGAPRDRVKLVVSMESDRANITDFQYVGDLVAARGSGTVGLNRDVDVKLNAGPVERVQAMFGETIGGAIGIITDQLLSYRVIGKVGATRLEPMIAGGAVGNVGQGVQNGAQSIGEGLEKLGQGIGNMLLPKPAQEPERR